jgi:sulfatase modifying factor 1
MKKLSSYFPLVAIVALFISSCGGNSTPGVANVSTPDIANESTPDLANESTEPKIKLADESTKPTIKWVAIPAGTFMMGSPTDEVDRNDNESQHEVSLSAFKMSAHEVTFAQYDAFCEATKRKKPSDEGWGRGQRPVINVGWNDATAFAKWVGARLPTEAEWEYACRAGSTTPFNTGENLTTNQANYNPYNNNATGINREHSTAVGSFPANAWGLYDMHGNVSEWCSDDRTYRGGGWFDDARCCRSANRYCGGDLYDRGNYFGFRLVSRK